MLQLTHTSLCIEQFGEDCAHFLTDGLGGIKCSGLCQIADRGLGGTNDLSVPLCHMVGKKLSEQEFEQRGLAAAVGADQSDAVVVLDLQADVGEQRLPVEYFIHMICFQQHEITSFVIVLYIIAETETFVKLQQN